MYKLSFFDPTVNKKYSVGYNYRLVANLCAIYCKLKGMKEVSVMFDV